MTSKPMSAGKLRVVLILVGIAAKLVAAAVKATRG